MIHVPLGNKLLEITPFGAILIIEIKEVFKLSRWKVIMLMILGETRGHKRRIWVLNPLILGILLKILFNFKFLRTIKLFLSKTIFSAADGYLLVSFLWCFRILLQRNVVTFFSTKNTVLPCFQLINFPFNVALSLLLH